MRLLWNKTKIDPTWKADDSREGEDCGVGWAAIALRGKQPPIECENLIQVIFIVRAKESVIFPQRCLLFKK